MTPTPTIKSITLTDGSVFEDRGEVRAPKKGDWYVSGDAAGVMRATYAYNVVRPILSPVEVPAGGIERRGDFVHQQITPHSFNTHDLNPLIDAACTVVNSMAYTDPAAESALANLAATLEPFTQAVKEDRYYAEEDDGQFHVRERRGAADFHVAKFRNKQDAKDFAAMKNSQEGE